MSSAPRAKNVMVGGREVVVRPMFGKDRIEMESAPPPTGTLDIVTVCARILKRTAPDITVEWLLENSDELEYSDIMSAYWEVLGRKKAEPGEAPAPLTGEGKSTP